MTFRFSISDLGTFLGKSPVTIRAWERKGLVKLPRVGEMRIMGVEDVRIVTWTAYRLERISEERRDLINETLTLLSMIEMENE